MDALHLPQDALSRELALEQAHVDRVYAQLVIATASAKSLQAEGRARFQTDRANFLREEDGTALFERDAFAFQAAKRLAILDSEHEGLVFGRIDTADPQTHYIGRIGVRDDDYEPLVIDWRAPAAEPFYRATPSSPMGVVRRRVLRCRNDIVIGIEDDLLDASTESDLVVIGEGALMAALKRARGHSMRDIVSTIQAEQDEAIRAPYPGVTIIAGGPGTGKTVVALHRAAYLLYSHRKRLEKGGVLVVGPSAVFMNYIERVLPSLGEDSVTLRSIGAVASDVIGRVAERVDPAPAAMVKGSLRMLQVLANLVNTPYEPVSEPVRVSTKGEILTLTPERAARIRTDILVNHRANQAREQAHHAVISHLFTKLPDSIELTRDQFDDLISSQAAFSMFMHAWWPTLDAPDLLLRLGDRALLDRIAPALDASEKDALAASYRGRTLQRPNWTIADMALLDELVAKIGPAPRDAEYEPSLFLDSSVEELVTTADLLTDVREHDHDAEPHDTFAHVLVDESQDVTPMQWRMLRRRGPQASWTLVGDPAQSSWPVADETDAALTTLIGHAPRRTFRLSTNYRSPAEVFTMAAKVIQTVYPDADLPQAVRSTGIEPLLVTAPHDALLAHIDAHITELAIQVEGTIGIVLPPSLVQTVVEASGELPALAEHVERLAIVTAQQSKGLEYDAVLVVSPDDIVAETAGGVRVLYVALTRPTQRLVVLDVVPSDQPDAVGAWREALA